MQDVSLFGALHYGTYTTDRLGCTTVRSRGLSRLKDRIRELSEGFGETNHDAPILNQHMWERRAGRSLRILQ